MFTSHVLQVYNCNSTRHSPEDNIVVTHKCSLHHSRNPCSRFPWCYIFELQYTILQVWSRLTVLLLRLLPTFLRCNLPFHQKLQFWKAFFYATSSTPPKRNAKCILNQFRRNAPVKWNPKFCIWSFIQFEMCYVVEGVSWNTLLRIHVRSSVCMFASHGLQLQFCKAFSWREYCYHL